MTLTKEKAAIIAEFLQEVKNKEICGGGNPTDYTHLFNAIGEGKWIQATSLGSVPLSFPTTIYFVYPASEYKIVSPFRKVEIKDVKVGDLVVFQHPSGPSKVVITSVGENSYEYIVTSSVSNPRSIGKTEEFFFDLPSYPFQIFRNGVEIKEVEA